jgi:hypothetical protein
MSLMMPVKPAKKRRGELWNLQAKMRTKMSRAALKCAKELEWEPANDDESLEWKPAHDDDNQEAHEDELTSQEVREELRAVAVVSSLTFRRAS